MMLEDLRFILSLRVAIISRAWNLKRLTAASSSAVPGVEASLLGFVTKRRHEGGGRYGFLRRSRFGMHVLKM
jgi:hypothetical protein